MKKIAIAQDLQMVYSRAQRMAPVHLHHPEVQQQDRCAKRGDQLCLGHQPEHRLSNLVPKVPSSFAARGRRRPAELSRACV